MAEADPNKKGESGKDLIRAVFGEDAIEKESIRRFTSPIQ